MSIYWRWRLTLLQAPYCWRCCCTPGPHIIARVLTIDRLHINAVALVVLLGIRLRIKLLFEAALIMAMLGFVSTVALARYLTRGDVLE